MSDFKCPSCGSPNVEKIDADKYQCPYCGKTFTYREAVSQIPQGQPSPVFQPDQVDDNPGCLMNGLSFLIPIAGVILYFVKKDNQPKSAKSYLTWGIAGFAVGILLQIITAAIQ